MKARQAKKIRKWKRRHRYNINQIHLALAVEEKRTHAGRWLPDTTYIAPYRLNNPDMVIPEWLTVKNLNKAQVVRRWGYERIRVITQWSLQNNGQEYSPFMEWEERLAHISLAQGRGFGGRDNKTGALLDVAGHQVLMNYWDGNVYLGHQIWTHSFRRIPHDFNMEAWGHMVRSS